MKCMIIAALAIVVAVQAKPYGGLAVDAGIGDLDGGLEGGLEGGIRELEGGVGVGRGVGLEGRVGLPGVGGRYESGRGYGHSGYRGGSSGYGNTGYGRGALKVGHNVGHQESEFDQATHRRESSGHNIGSALQTGAEGQSAFGHRNYGTGSADYGHGYRRGGDYVV